MKRKYWLLLLVFAVLLNGSPVLADGDFYVVAVGGGVGTKITSLPYTITNPGFYYLTSNLSYPSGTSDGITVASDDVTIDLMGFKISGPGSSSNGSGINLWDGANAHKNIEVRNGTLNGWNYGLTDNNNGYRNRAINLRIENCYAGINLGGNSGGNLVKGCSVDGGGGNGIYINGGVASGNTVINCVSASGIIGYGNIFSGNTTSNCSTGIYSSGASSIIGNTVVTNGSIYAGIYINSGTTPVLVTQNTVSGPSPHFYGGGSAIVNVSNAGF